MPKFSIIIPVFNVEVYLNQCLDSIVNQSFSDFEVICINDGSTDNSLDILNNYAKKDNRFKVFTQENQGQGTARNKALDLAQGQYVLFIDPDDWIESDTFKNLLNAYQITKSDVIEFNYKEYNEYSGTFKTYNLAKKMRKKFNFDLDLVSFYSLKDVKKGCLSKLDFHVWSRAYSLEFLKRVNACFAPAKTGEDHLFSCIVVFNAEKISYLDKTLYNYRCRQGSSINKISPENMVIFQNIELLKEYLKKHNFYDEYEKEFKNYALKVLCWHYTNLPDDCIKKYEQMCQKFLVANECKKLFYKAKTNNSFFENVFSIKNERKFGVKRKIITILWVKIKI
mgnify:CR=1 FL=1